MSVECATAHQMPNRILILVSDPDGNQDLVSILSSAKFSVANAVYSREALLELTELNPEIVILDALSEEGDIEACSDLADLFQVPVILVCRHPTGRRVVVKEVIRPHAGPNTGLIARVEAAIH